MADQNNKKVVKVYDTEQDVAVSLAKYTADLSAKFAKERGSFTVVLSGGYLIDSIRLVTGHFDLIIFLSGILLEMLRLNS